MRMIILPLLLLPLVVGCTADGEDTASKAVSAQEQPQTQPAKPTMETVYKEPADRAADPQAAQKREAREGVSARAMQKSRDAAAIAIDVDYEAQGGPEGANALAQLLRAREVDMIPRADALQADPHAAQKLLFIEDNTALVLEGQRALSLMRHVYDAEVRARLIARAQDTAIATPMRAAALRSLVAAADASDADVQQVLEDARSDDNARIQKAATP